MDFLNLLFGDIGKKIKGFAIFMFFSELIAGIITCFVFMAEDPVWFLLIFTVPIAAYLLSIPLYAIGELIDATQENRDINKAIYNLLYKNKHFFEINKENIPRTNETFHQKKDVDTTSKNKTNSHRWMCECGKMIDSYPCYNCGKSPEDQTASSFTNAENNKNKEIPVTVYKKSDGKIICPTCQQRQNGDRYICLNCGQVFANGQPDIPYWCANCGKPGPFNEECPQCKSSQKIYNK